MLCARENMKVTTNITKLDLLKFNLRFIPTAPITYKYFALVSFAIFGYVSYAKGLPESYEQWKIVILGSFSGGLIATLVYFSWCIVSVLIFSKESNGVLGKHEYEVRAEGLFEKTIANETLNRWGSLGKVTVAGPNLLLQVSGYLYHVFPKRCFESDEAFNNFKKVLLEKVSIAHKERP
jgi:hypothetical protein